MKINESKSRIELFFMVVWFLTMGIELKFYGGEEKKRWAGGFKSETWNTKYVLEPLRPSHWFLRKEKITRIRLENIY